MTDAIYFVEPSRNSVAQILNDFPEEDKFDYDQYGQTHIVFTSSCSESLLENISMNEKLVSRTQSFIEANIDFQVFFDNIFTVSTLAAEKMIP